MKIMMFNMFELEINDTLVGVQKNWVEWDLQALAEAEIFKLRQIVYDSNHLRPRSTKLFILNVEKNVRLSYAYIP